MAAFFVPMLTGLAGQLINKAMQDDPKEPEPEHPKPKMQEMPTLQAPPTESAAMVGMNTNLGQIDDQQAIQNRMAALAGLRGKLGNVG